MKKINLLFWFGIILLLIPNLIYAYFLMPFPGSQDQEVMSFIYRLHQVLMPLRIIGILIILFPLWKIIRRGKRKQKIGSAIGLLLCCVLFYFTDFKFKAERMFEEPQVVLFLDAKESKVPDSLLVIGVVHNGVAKAYPLNYLGYHHKVQDSVGTLPVLVTYCTMCRTGRVYSPIVNGVYQSFRLVGARHYNAVIEDRDTKTWWYQATGEAAVRPLKGEKLSNIPYDQLTLRSWLKKHPQSLVLQPDRNYQEGYDHLKDYDRKQAIEKDSTIANKDSVYRKSWVIGIEWNKKSKAFLWRDVLKAGFVNDEVGGMPLLVIIEEDKLSYHAWSRKVLGKELTFLKDSLGIKDMESGSRWDQAGFCFEGQFKGSALAAIPAHQEYLHSWKFFHPGTSVWPEEKKLLTQNK